MEHPARSMSPEPVLPVVDAGVEGRGSTRSMFPDPIYAPVNAGNEGPETPRSMSPPPDFPFFDVGNQGPEISRSMSPPPDFPIFDASIEDLETAETDETAKSYEIIKWPSLPDLPRVQGTTINFARPFYAYGDSTVLKLGINEGEAQMTDFAYQVLGKLVPRVSGLVRIEHPQPQRGILMDRMPGTPISELWTSLSPVGQAKIMDSLVVLLVEMRLPRSELDYYGRPDGKPYITPCDFIPGFDTHRFCTTYQEWNASRADALPRFAKDSEIDQARIHELERLQKETQIESAPSLLEQPVLTHGDLSDRNILIDPKTLEITGLIDWELANVAPAYFEYAAARLCGGHDPAWREVLLEVLRRVARIECGRHIAAALQETSPIREHATSPESEDVLFHEVMAAWNALVNVERPAQRYSDACYWTFEE